VRLRLTSFSLLLLFCLFARTADCSTSNGYWSLQPIVRPEVPAPGRDSSAVDAFVSTKLNGLGLTLSPEADRRTLVRRLFYDVTGLPPTPEQASAFLHDESPEAYSRLVDRLLDSPQFGEKWARHWLDVVRFAETHGFEMNQPRPNAWPYRDYVIRAFNDDKPYDQFVIEQLAGDVFGVDEATGFLVAGPWDQVKSPDPVLTANQRADELHDIVSTTSSTFLGLTVGCARCHDHKFDPIPQQDYYAIKAVFEGVQHGERKRRTPEAQKNEDEIAQLKRELAEVDAQIEAAEPIASVTDVTMSTRMPVNARRNVERIVPVNARKLRFTILKTNGAEPCIDELEVFTSNHRNVALAGIGTKARASSVYPNSDLHRLEHINDGRYGNGRSWISNEPGQGWVQLEFAEPVTISKIVWARDREEKFNDRLATEYRIEIRTPEDEWKVVASSVDRQPFGSKETTPGALTALVTKRTQLERRRRELTQAPMAYAGMFKSTPDPTPRLNRGDPMQPRDPVAPGALSAIGIPFACAVSDSLTEDQRRRLAFARWIVDARNPLTARVIVNRIWQYHFGQGLVSTPSDFGVNGAKPTHPELLDWLAAELISHHWSLKHIHRLILNSATYRQSSATRTEALQADAGTRLLWRFPSRRLDAESIRDSILMVGGKLDLREGGPGFSFFEPNENYVRVYNARASWPADTFRRMVYGTVVRQRPDGVFGVFDCPDAGQIAPRRTSSTTPLQALNLLNSAFIVEQSEFFAKRLKAEAGPSVEEQIRRAFLLAYLREPSADEQKAATKLARSEGLPILCRALLNTNEFVYLF
jgi:hypothetical protein